MFRNHPLCGAIGLSAVYLTASGAAAQDGGLRLIFGIEQSIELGRNLGLDVPAEGTGTIAATTLSFGLSSQSALDTLEFIGSAALLVENSPDTAGTETDITRPTLGFSYTREVPNALFGIDLRFVRDDVARLAEDLADADAAGRQTEYGIALQFETGRTAPVGFFAEAALAVVEFDNTIDPDLIDTRTSAVTAGTRLRLSEVMTGTFALGFIRDDEAGDIDPTDTLSATLDFDYALANGIASFGLTQSSEDGGENRTTLEIGRALDLPNGTVSARLGITRSDLGDTDVIGGIDWTRALPDGAITFGMARSSSFASDSAETTVATDVVLDWRRDINAVSSIALGASWSQSTSPSEQVEETEFGATYSQALTADWRLDSGVRYRARDDIEGRAYSPMVFVTLGRSFDIRP